MAISLKDQLLKAGLADNKRARQADHAKRQAAKGKTDGESAASAVQKAREAQVEKDREASRQLILQQEQKAVAAQIRQLIEAHRIERKGGELSYQFSDERKVKKLLVSEPQQYQLIHGQIAIVRLDERYELVPAAIAEKIQQRDPAPIVLLNSRQVSAVADDDPYADYQIPDDLMW
ncbi:MAG: DUF2058 domain-containing protein [Pseudomonadota bacterium]